jgi:hypothetical protein
MHDKLLEELFEIIWRGWVGAVVNRNLKVVYLVLLIRLSH